MSPSYVRPPLRVFLVMYDLPSDEHPSMRNWTRNWAGEENEGWVRVQRSIVLMRLRATVAGVSRDALEPSSGVETGRVMIVDITTSDYHGRGSAEVWEWLAQARKDARADLDRYNREKADQGLDELEKFANEGDE